MRIVGQDNSCSVLQEREFNLLKKQIIFDGYIMIFFYK